MGNFDSLLLIGYAIDFATLIALAIICPPKAGRVINFFRKNFFHS